MDITQLILDDHFEQRRLFSILEQIPARDIAGLSHLWMRLASFLELHAQAEEELFYPALLTLTSGTAQQTLEAETIDAIGDHNEIRDAVAAAAKEQVGSAGWYAAVASANTANGDHMAEEEREGLTSFRRGTSLQLRHEIAVKFAIYEATNYAGVRPVDKDPQQYVRQIENRGGSVGAAAGTAANTATNTAANTAANTAVSGSLDIGSLRS